MQKRADEQAEERKEKIILMKPELEIAQTEQRRNFK